MILGIYESKECDNSIIRRSVDGMLNIEIVYFCSFCNKSHEFYLKTVVDE